MADNLRVLYAIYKLGIAPVGSESFDTIHGLQSAGMTTTFNLEQVFEIGQIAIYENIEGIPDVELTLEKVCDGWPPIITLVSQNATASSLIARAKESCTVGVPIYSDENESATGTPVSEVQLSGLYVSSLGYQASVDGNCTESVTLVGNNKIWVGHTGAGLLTAGTYDDGTNWDGSAISSNDDIPLSIGGSGGVNRREDVLFGASASYTLLPTELPGIDSDGYNVPDSAGNFPCRVQRISMNADLGREPMFELGRRGAYHRYATYPVEVTSEITIMSVSGDMISATEEGIYDEAGGPCGHYNLTDQTIQLALCEGLTVNVGTKNKLSSVGVTGGDAGGGNQEITYTYTNFNVMTITHPMDPNANF